MPAVARQPFAPLNEARLQSLTSLKNRQNGAASPASGGKRKAELLDTDDFENVDPLLFAKRSKGGDASLSKDLDFVKPSNFILTKASASPSLPAATAAAAAATPPPARSLGVNPSPRRTLPPKSPAAKLNTSVSKSTPLSAPAGRSPTRGKRSGILSSRRRASGPYTRVDPPSFNLGSAAPFSLDAALKGTIPSYSSRATATSSRKSATDLHEPDMKASWFFDIHEDTAEQEMTNLLQHSTCVLDISSDEESEQKATLDRAEGRDKENIPPVDDVSQTSARNAPRLGPNTDEMLIEKERVALGEMNTADYFAHGCDESSVIIVPADEEESPEQQGSGSAKQQTSRLVQDFEFAPELKSLGTASPAEALDAETQAEPEQEPRLQDDIDIDALVSKPDEGSSKAAVLQPMEGTGESFDLWESGSAKDEAEVPEIAAVAA